MLPHKVLSPDFEEDIFINYAHADNETLMEDLKGFVDKVHAGLALRLRQLIGEEPKIWRDVLLEGNQQLTETIVIKLSKTVFLMCVLTPSYVNSDWCRKELNAFYQRASKNKGITINNRSRIFKVLKTPIGTDPTADPLENSGLCEELRKVLRESLGYEFYEFDKLTGRLREFSREFGDEYERKHASKVEDLAQDIVRFVHDEELQKSFAKSVYLAETTPELNEERNEIRRNLLQHGYNVLPDQNLPFESKEFDSKVKGYLQRCSLSIHLVSSDFATTDADYELQHRLFVARVEKQHQLAMSRGEDDPEYSRLVWMPTAVTPREEINQEFLAYLQNDPAVQENAEILSGSKLEDLKTIIQRRLKISWEASSTQVIGKRVYVVYDRQDKDAVAPVQAHLRERGYEVLLPFCDGDQACNTHTENVRLADAILVFYGTSNTMKFKLAELRKINVNRASRPLLAQGIYVAGSETDHKKAFTTDEVLLMKCFGNFSPDSIKPFLDRLEKGASVAA